MWRRHGSISTIRQAECKELLGTIRTHLNVLHRHGGGDSPEFFDMIEQGEVRRTQPLAWDLPHWQRMTFA